MEQEAFKVTVELTYYLPADLAERESIYGTTDPMECVAVDLDNDPAATLVDYSDEQVLVSVEPIT